MVHVIAADNAVSELDPKSEQWESARKRLAELAVAAGYGGTVKIAVGPVKETLLSAAKESQADVLVIDGARRPDLSAACGTSLTRLFAIPVPGCECLKGSGMRLPLVAGN